MTHPTKSQESVRGEDPYAYDEAGKTRFSAPSPGEPLMLEGSKKGAGDSQHPSAPSRVIPNLVTVP